MLFGLLDGREASKYTDDGLVEISGIFVIQNEFVGMISFDRVCISWWVFIS